MNRMSGFQQLATALMLAPAMTLAGEVTLTGQGSVRYQPDSARLQFTASAEHERAQQATELVAAQMSEWRRAISQYRAQLQDYTDATVNLYSRTSPAQDRDEPPAKRAVASQTVSFQIDDLELLNPLLEQAQAIGLNYHLGPHQFFHSDEEGLEQQALANAIADAKSRCQFVARQLEQSCGDVVSIHVDGGFRPVPMMMAEAKGAADTVSSVGVREVSATVNATFELN